MNDLSVSFDRPFQAPDGYACCNVWLPEMRMQLSHLVVRTKTGTPGPTLCGLTRFDTRDPETYALLTTADIPGWSINGGISGPGITQQPCPECWHQLTLPHGLSTLPRSLPHPHPNHE